MPKIDFSEWFEGPDLEADAELYDYLCTCKGKKPNDYSLTITEGNASLRHKPCGKEVTDYPEEISMEEELTVNVEWVSDGCDPPGGWHGDIGRCDCGYWVNITLAKDE